MPAPFVKWNSLFGVEGSGNSLCSPFTTSSVGHQQGSRIWRERRGGHQSPPGLWGPCLMVLRSLRLSPSGSGPAAPPSRGSFAAGGPFAGSTVPPQKPVCVPRGESLSDPVQAACLSSHLPSETTQHPHLLIHQEAFPFPFLSFLAAEPRKA